MFFLVFPRFRIPKGSSPVRIEPYCPHCCVNDKVDPLAGVTYNIVDQVKISLGQESDLDIDSPHSAIYESLCLHKKDSFFNPEFEEKFSAPDKISAVLPTVSNFFE